MNSPLDAVPTTKFDPKPRFDFLWVVLVSLCFASEAQNADSKATASIPYPTGSHRQLVRKFSTTADGLPGNEVRALAVTRGNVVFMASSNGVARLDGERWRNESGLSGVTALFAPSRGPEAF